MNEPRELELKYHFEEKKDYLRMLDGCPPAPSHATALQENHYFDSPEYGLARQSAMLRIRFDGKLKLCFKLGSEQPGCPGYFNAIEVECEAEPGLLKDALENPGRLLELDLEPVKSLKRHCGNIHLIKIGHLATTRRYRMLQEFLLELDEITYDDGEKVHELEIETPSPEQARRFLLLKFTELSINACPQHRSKLHALLIRNGVDLPE